MITEMGKPLPARRRELACWSSEKNGQSLVRNRRTGETFQVGYEEKFLLEQLDGRQNAERICAAFAAQFGHRLSTEGFFEFLELADQRGFLQPAGIWPTEGLSGFEVRQSSGGFTDQPFTQSAAAGSAQRDAKARAPSLLKRDLGRCLTRLATMLQSFGEAIQSAGRRIHHFRLKHFAFVPRTDDVFIVTYPRSGTTWMQMILYQLTTDGNMGFPHIAEYCPWFERSLRAAQGFENRPSPRIFKSHLPYQKIPKGPGKYIYVARAGKDVAISYYHLYRMYQGYAGTFEEFFQQFMRGKVQFGSWFIRRISAFCGLNVPADRLPGIIERCSFNFMKKHEAQFDPALELVWEQGTQLNSFLRKGCVGEGAIHLNSEQTARFDEEFRLQLAGTGLGQPTAEAPHT